MLVYAFLLILLLRPSWGLLNFFSAIAALLFAYAAYREVGLDPVLIALNVVIMAAVFYAIGALFVFLRLRFKQRRTRQDKEIDAELARIRGEAPAQRTEPPPS